MSPTINLYWDDPTFARMTPIVRFAVHTILAHHPDGVVFHDDSTLDAAIKLGSLDRDKVYAMKPQFKADIVRNYLMATQGGIWLDCDYICFKPVYDLVQQLDDKYDFGACKYTNDWDNDVLVALPNSDGAADFWHRLCQRLVETDYTPPSQPPDIDGQDREWGFVGRTLLRRMENEGMPIRDLGRELVAPLRILLAIQQDAQWEGEIDAVKAGWYGVMLVNNYTSKYMAEKSIEEIAQSKTVGGAFVRAAMRLLPTAQEMRKPMAGDPNEAAMLGEKTT